MLTIFQTTKISKIQRAYHLAKVQMQGDAFHWCWPFNRLNGIGPFWSI